MKQIVVFFKLNDVEYQELVKGKNEIECIVNAKTRIEYLRELMECTFNEECTAEILGAV